MFRIKKKKKYKIPGDKIRRLIESEEGCIATDRITFKEEIWLDFKLFNALRQKMLLS